MQVIDESDLFSGFFYDIDLKYRNFESSPIKDPDLVLQIGNFTPSNYQCQILDENYFIRNNYLYCKKTSYKRATWRFDLMGFEKGQINARITNNLFGGMFISGNIIDPLIQYVLAYKGYSIIHASGIGKDGKAFLYPSRSGGGKTKIALRAIERNYDFFGDNFIIIKNGLAITYLSPLNLFNYNTTRVIKKQLTLKEKSSLQVKRWIHAMSLGYVKIFTKINPTRITNKIVDIAPIYKCFLIIPKDSFNIERISKQKCISHLLYNQKMEFLYFDRHIHQYANLYPGSKFSLFWETYSHNLAINLPDYATYYRIETPTTIDNSIIDNILSLV